MLGWGLFGRFSGGYVLVLFFVVVVVVVVVVVIFVFFRVEFILKFLFVPGIVAEVGIGHAGAVDDDLLRTRGEIGVGQVVGGGLQGVEEEGGGFVLDLSGQEETHDLHESELDGVGVFEEGEGEGRWRSAAGAVGVELSVGALPEVVEEAEAKISESGRAALGPVDLDVLATLDVVGIKTVG